MSDGVKNTKFGARLQRGAGALRQKSVNEANKRGVQIARAFSSEGKENVTRIVVMFYLEQRCSFSSPFFSKPAARTYCSRQLLTSALAAGGEDGGRRRGAREERGRSEGGAREERVRRQLNAFYFLLCPCAAEHAALTADGSPARPCAAQQLMPWSRRCEPRCCWPK